jgi:tRNA dimethylallyltransferase
MPRSSSATLELHEAGGSLAPPRPALWTEETRHPTRTFGLEVARDALADRIETRTRAMFDQGVGEEVQRARAATISSTAAQIIGLREIGTLPREEAIAAIALRTRQYAAYQRKWMRRMPGLIGVSAQRAPAEVASEIAAAHLISPF